MHGTAFFQTTMAAIAFLPSFAFAQAIDGGPGRGGYMHGPGMMWGDGMGGFGMFFGFFFMLLLIAAFIVGTVLILRYFGVGGHAVASHGAPAGNAALDILKARYAKGEIDSKEFEERRRLLSE